MAITVTAAESGSTFNGILLRVKVLTGAAASQAGAATAVFAGTGPQEASITTTATGSQVYGALKTSSTATLTAAAGTTLIDNFVDSPNTELLGTCRTTSATGTPGATTVGASAPSVGGQTALLEILPVGTITEDASSPAVATATGATTTTTASFTPPPGSLLVAICCADANGSTVVTVSSTGGLVWTQQVHSLAGGSATGYAGVWTATMPALAAAPAAVRAAPGPVWLRRFRHRQQAAPALPLTVIGTASLAGAGSVSSGMPAFPAIPGVARPGQFTPGNPGGSAMVFPAPPPALFLSPRAQPGGSWLRRFRHRQQFQQAVPAGVTTTVATAAIAGAGAVSTTVTQAVIASPAGAGAVAAVVTEIAGAAAAGAGSITNVITEAVTAPLAGGAAVTGTVTQGGGGTLGGAGALNALVVQQAPAAAAGAGAIAALVTEPVIASLTGAGALSATSGGFISGTAGLAGAGSLTAASTVFASATAALAGAGAVTVKGAQGAVASLPGAGAVGALAVLQAPAVLTAAGTLTAAAVSHPPNVPAASTATVTDPRDGTASVFAPGPASVYLPAYAPVYAPDPAPPGPKVTGGTTSQSSVSDG